MNIQNNQVAPQYEKLAVLKPNFFLKNPSMLGYPAPLRAGLAPRMALDVDSVLEPKLPVVDI